MQKTRGKITAFLMVITSAAACVLLFVQMNKLADGVLKSGSDKAAATYPVYAVVLLGFIFAVLYASVRKNNAKVFDFENGGRGLSLSSAVLALTFFYDFIHQGYNCYAYISATEYVNYAYVISLGITGVFAFISCFYFITLSMTAGNENYDFRNFTLLHFAPVVWAFTKLFLIMTQIIDINEDAELFCEFLLLCIILCFLISMISAVDRRDAPATGFFIFSCAALAFMSCVVGIPRIAMIITGRGSEPEQVTFSAVTYIMLGVFSLSLLHNINKRSQRKQ